MVRWLVVAGGGSGRQLSFLATLLGVGIGLLAAPQPGSKTRKLLLKRLAALSEGVGEGLEDVEKVSSKARKRAKERLAKLRENAEDEWGAWRIAGRRPRVGSALSISGKGSLQPGGHHRGDRRRPGGHLSSDQ